MSQAPTDWSPLGWGCALFPLPGPDVEIVTMDFIVAALNAQADLITEADSTALGPALHVAHILKTWQGADGRWPDRVNLRTGQVVGEGRSLAPLALFRRLGDLLNSSEFDRACAFAEAGGSVPRAERNAQT